MLVPKQFRQLVFSGSMLIISASLAIACTHNNNRRQRNESGLKNSAMKMDGTTEIRFGTVVKDPFRWLEDIEDKKVIKWMTSRDLDTRNALKNSMAKRYFAERISSIERVDKILFFQERPTGLFFWVRKPGADRAFLMRRNHDGKENIVVNENEFEENVGVDKSRTKISWDGKFVLLPVRADNADGASLKLFDLEKGVYLESDSINDILFGCSAWNKSSSGYYYVWYPASEEHTNNERLAKAEVRFHEVGTPTSQDTTVIESTNDPTQLYDISTFRNEELLVTSVYSTGVIKEVILAKQNREWKTAKVKNNCEFKVVGVVGDNVYLVTDDNAARSKIVEVNIAKTKSGYWRDVVQEDKKRYIQDAKIVANGEFIVLFMTGLYSELELLDKKGSLKRKFDLPGKGIVSDIEVGERGKDVYFTFESYISQRRLFRTSIDDGRMVPVSKENRELQNKKVVERIVFYKSTDGTEIPMFLIHNENLKLDGNNPVWMNGYGGFGISWTPYFISAYWAWIEIGGVIAAPILRGGGEFGENWHKDGMLDKKQNVFDDFIKAAEWLIEKKYTNHKRIGTWGGSNGGLLMGAVMTQRPDLFRVVICDSPILDMIRYTNYGYGKSWIPEYGDPNKEEEFKWLHSYSPYHNIHKNTVYPSLLVIVASSDYRVHPMHANKFLAAMEVAQADKSRKMALLIKGNSGHFGSSNQSAAIENSALTLAFLFQELSLDKEILALK